MRRWTIVSVRLVLQYHHLRETEALYRGLSWLEDDPGVPAGSGARRWASQYADYRNCRQPTPWLGPTDALSAQVAYFQ